MKRRKLIKLTASGVAIAPLFNLACHRLTSANLPTKIESISESSSGDSMTIKVMVDWQTQQAVTTSFVFGSNDYEIIKPEGDNDRVYQNVLGQLNVRLIRIHQGNLSNEWSDPNTQTWNENKIKAGYDRSYPQKPTIIQNITGWPQWMKQGEGGLLDPSEYDRYANFCAELVDIINNRQQRKVIYWEPLNEQDVRYEKAGKLNELWEIYNRTATAMKAKDPSIKVGGPVLTWDEQYRLDYFLQVCGANVDFVSWHRYSTGDAKEPTDRLMSNTPNYGNQVRTFREVVTKNIRDRHIPLLLGEYNINYAWDSGETRQNTHIGAVWYASVLKHLSDAGIEMAASWHLKDGIYGLIDPSNNLRPSAHVFAWGIKHLTGKIMRTETADPFVEAMAVQPEEGRKSLLLINKSDKIATLKLEGMEDFTKDDSVSMLTLDETGNQEATLSSATIKQGTLSLNPYSLVLLLK